jgi:hypothetical protein
MVPGLASLPLSRGFGFSRQQLAADLLCGPRVPDLERLTRASTPMFL